LNTVAVSGVYNAARTSLANSYTIAGITLTSPVYLTASYYDSYAFMGIPEAPNNADTQYNAEAGYGVRYTTGYQGLLTGTLTAQMNPDGTVSSACIYSIMYYDYRNRLIQTKSNNPLPGGLEKEYIAYDFMNSPIGKKHVHSATGKTTQTEVYVNSYDHAERLTKTTHQLNGGTVTTLSEKTYDELGRLKTSKKGGLANLNTTYGYNIRSWIKSVGNPLFAENLYYNESYGGSAKCYNGNLSAMNWTATGDKNRGYAFAYDNLSRLAAANYLENGAVNANYKTAYSYDKMGNLLTLQRYGKTSATVYGLTDNLTFSYAGTGNQLVKVEDAVANIPLAESADFKNYSNTTPEYVYNANGAMTKDLNKGISDIQYNSLNLPRLMDIKSPVAEARNEYTYSATGQKLKVVQKWNPNYSTTPVVGSAITVSSLTMNKTTDYIGNMIYENGALKRILVDGGYIEDGQYYYFGLDHLGNTRMIVKSANNGLIQKNVYYPFGMAFAETPVAEQGVQPYKYNGKELDMMSGLNQYDYSARYYDPALARFTTPDPLAEKYPSISPYAYCANNPVRFVDIDGKDPGDVFKTPNAAAKDWGKYYNGASILRNREFGSAIYEVKSKDGKVIGYAYSVANIGNDKKVIPSLSPHFEKEVADIHSHGAYIKGADNNNFSPSDKADNKTRKVQGYLASPDGSLKKYDPQKGEDKKPVAIDMPSDKKDPDRKNKVEPTDIPKEKKEKNKVDY
jgi:RHS repeat-associated protein